MLRHAELGRQGISKMIPTCKNHSQPLNLIKHAVIFFFTVVLISAKLFLLTTLKLNMFKTIIHGKCQQKLPVARPFGTQQTKIQSSVPALPLRETQNTSI